MIKKKKAFSLVELMVGIIILMVVLPAMLVSFFSLFILNELTEHIILASLDAQRVVEQMRSLSEDSLTSITTQNWSTWASNNGCDNLPSEQIQVVYTDINGNGDPLDDNPLAVTVIVSWRQRQRLQNLSFSTLITQR